MRRLAVARFALVAGLWLVLDAPARAGVTSAVVGGVEVITDTTATPAPVATHGKKAKPRRPTPAAANVPQPLSASPLGEMLARDAQQFVGVPYVWGGASPAGFDCSGFVQYVFARHGVALPRTADAQFAVGMPVLGDPLPGDLVFFQTYDYGASHVGIYLGNGYFINSLRPGVHVASFASTYFRERYLGARRYV